ncbi:hypothetical protein BVI434_320013 [Burkholderia vietnamiensis]|nr:hypothetical protein BVI434_320013 [Burkholderia vietnamiensis]
MPARSAATPAAAERAAAVASSIPSLPRAGHLAAAAPSARRAPRLRVFYTAPRTFDPPFTHVPIRF